MTLSSMKDDSAPQEETMQTLTKPKWQRARILDSEYPQTINRCVWLASAPPSVLPSRGIESGRAFAPIPIYETALLLEAESVWIDANLVELLPEFANDVPLVDWRDFLKGVEA